jgi:hypothetical protein
VSKEIFSEKSSTLDKVYQVNKLEALNLKMAPQKYNVALVVLLVSTGCVLAQHPRIPIAPCSGK